MLIHTNRETHTGNLKCVLLKCAKTWTLGSMPMPFIKCSNFSHEFSVGNSRNINLRLALHTVCSPSQRDFFSDKLLVWIDDDDDDDDVNTTAASIFTLQIHKLCLVRSYFHSLSTYFGRVGRYLQYLGILFDFPVQNIGALHS